MSNEDRARQIAERVARRVAARPGGNASTTRPDNGYDRELQSKNAARQAGMPRARIIDFVSSGPPLRTVPSITSSGSSAETSQKISSRPAEEFFQFVPVTQSPWLGRLPSMLAAAGHQPTVDTSQPAEHSSQERFGVDEAAVAELVEFFENEKKCSIDPSGKPCDHCAMCSSRGF